MSLLGLKAIRSTACRVRLGTSSTTARQGLHVFQLQSIHPGTFLASGFSTTRTLHSDHQTRVFLAKKFDALTSSTAKRESMKLERRMDTAQKLIRHPARLERELTLLLAEHEMLASMKIFAHGWARAGGRSAAFLRDPAIQVLQKLRYFAEVCWRGPWHEVGVKRWSMWAFLLGVPLMAFGAVYFVVYSTVLYVLCTAFGL